MDIKRLLSEHIAQGNAQTAVARAMNISGATLSAWLNGKYNGNNERIEELVETYLGKVTNKTIEISSYKKDFDFVRTSVFNMIERGVNLTMSRGEFRVIVGDSGIGKTTALKAIKAADETVILVEVYRGIRKNRFLSKLCKAADIVAKNSFDENFELLCDKLKNTGRLIMIDEVEHLPIDALDALRRLNDFTGCGVVMAGLPIFYERLKSNQSDYAYIYNRITIVMQLERLNINDVDALVSTMLSSDEVTADVWFSCCVGIGRDLKIIALESLRVADLNNSGVNSNDFGNIVKLVTKKLGRVS